jgi:Large-conductance mechanosensitive channel, MscL
MSFASESKEFAVKGNVMDLAVGFIIGAAFGKIVDDGWPERNHGRGSRCPLRKRSFRGRF